MSVCTVALSGLSDIDAAAFDAAIEAMPHGTWQTVNRTPATLLIVDIDTVWGHMDWLRATANGQRVAAYTREEQVRGCELVLHKPLQRKEFKQLVANLAGTGQPGRAPPATASTRQAAASAALEPTATPPDPAHAAVPPAPAVATTESEPAAGEPETIVTLGECLLAGDIGAPVSMQGPDGIRLTLDPPRGGYTTATSKLEPLRPLLGMPIAQARPLDAPAIERMRRAPALPLTRLLWFAALCAHPGQLAPTLDAQARYRLARWPQIEREFPRHFRIATAMMKAVGTLDDIAAAANAPAADVADFINAYSVAGYVSCLGAPGADVPPAGGGVLSRLRRPFSRGGQEPA